MSEVRRPVATLLEGSESDLFFLAAHLQRGGVAAVPTETVYGLAANALNAEACRRVFEVKARPAHDPLIVHVADRAAADAVARFNEPAETLAARFWPGPLTLILEKLPVVPDIVTSGRPTVAVRAPAHPLMHALLRRSGLTLAAPSANPFGGVSPTTAAHVQAGLGDRIAYILDGGPCTIGVESTIIDARDPADPVILRPGGVAREALEAALGRTVRVFQRTAAAARKSGPPDAMGELAPGMLDKHYSPRTPVRLREGRFAPAELTGIPVGIARVCIHKPASLPDGEARCRLFWLSETGSLEEAARRLFAMMRELDESGYAALEFEPAPDTGIGLAINDRLRRAAAG